MTVRIAMRTSAVPRSGCFITSAAGTTTAAIGSHISQMCWYERLGLARIAGSERGAEIGLLHPGPRRPAPPRDRQPHLPNVLVRALGACQDRREREYHEQ